MFPVLTSLEYHLSAVGDLSIQIFGTKHIQVKKKNKLLSPNHSLGVAKLKLKGIDSNASDPLESWIYREEVVNLAHMYIVHVYTNTLVTSPKWANPRAADN